jgi:leucyl-tRNA synthetase
MFIGPWDQGGPFSVEGIQGVQRFYVRAWELITGASSAEGTPDASAATALERAFHQTIQRVQEAYESLSYNVALAALMEFSNRLRDARGTAVMNSPVWAEALDGLLVMLAPIAPHLTEELWATRGNAFSIHQQPWPVFDAERAREESFELVIQVNGKVRDRVQAPVGSDEARARELALASSRVQELLDGNAPRRVIYVPGRLVNVVV